MIVQGVPKTYRLVRRSQSRLPNLLKFWLFVDFFIGDLVPFSDLKNFDFEGPKSELKFFKNSQKQATIFVLFFPSYFFAE